MEQNMKSNTYKLDNSAIIFPFVKTKKWTAMFRMAVTLKEDINVDILKEALTKVLIRLPAFSTTLKSGFFWYYLKEIDGLPPIEKDVKYPMESLDIKANNGFLFRVRYNKNMLAIEYFHSLTDGTGGLTFLMTIVKEYLSIKYNEQFDVNEYILDVDKPFIGDEFKDDFPTYYRKSKTKSNRENCYVPKGKKFPTGYIDITSAELNTDELRSVAQKYGVTVGVLLTSIVMYSYYINLVNENKRLPIKVSVPVNLRNYYPSKTLCNFITIVTPGISDYTKKYDFIDIINILKAYFKNDFTEENINREFSKMVAIENNVFVKYVPLFIKKLIIKLIFTSQNNLFSTTFSNLGNIVLPKKISEYVEKIDFILGQPSIPKSIGSCVSYNNKTIINFSRTIANNVIEKVFLETLKELGISTISVVEN